MLTYSLFMNKVKHSKNKITWNNKQAMKLFFSLQLSCHLNLHAS